MIYDDHLKKNVDITLKVDMKKTFWCDGTFDIFCGFTESRVNNQ